METPYFLHASGNWRRWFAWYPLLINGQPVWLQTVLRRPECCEIDGVTEQYWVYQIPQVGRRRADIER